MTKKQIMNNASLNDYSTQTNGARRRLMKSFAVVAATAAGTTLAPSTLANTTTKRSSPSESELINALSDCMQTGEICFDHCIALVAEDDTTIADCLRTVRAMLPSLHALLTLASASSEHTAKLANVCIELCEDCRKECEKHAHHHAECKACMESCEKCIKECKKIATRS